MKATIFFLTVLMIMTPSLYAGTVEETGPDFSGYEQAGDYWVKVFINDVRGRLSVRLFNKNGNEDLTDVPEIKGKVTFIDKTEKNVVFKPEHIYTDQNEDIYTGQPIGYSSTYYVMADWLKGIGCVDTTIYLYGKELTFTCKPEINE